MRSLIQQALRRADELVLVFEYSDVKGVLTRRVVSPVRILKGDRLLALCLSREEPRQFQLGRCLNMRLERAENFVMPVPIVQVSLSEVLSKPASVPQPADATTPSLAEPQAAA